MATTKKINAAQAMDDLRTRKHHIEETKASGMLKKFKSFRTKLAGAIKNGDPVPANCPDLPIAVTYNKKAIQSLLKLPGFDGLRIFPAINADNAMTFVLVGIDENGNTIPGSAVMSKGTSSGTIVDEGQMSPPYPAPAL